MKQTYKVKNFDSIILKEMSIQKEGNDPSLLASQSNKYIWVICRYCGEPNRVKKSKYTLSGNSNCHMECRRKELKEVDSTWSRKDVKQKIKNSLIEKYGVDHSSKIEGMGEKRKEVFQERYGVDNPSQLESIKERKRETCLKNYGTEYPLQNKEIYEKSKKTVQLKYRVDRPVQNEKIQEKMINSFIEIYGYDNPMKNNEIAKKARENLIHSILNSNDPKYKLFQEIFNNKHDIWEWIKEKSLTEIADKMNVDYEKLRRTISCNKELKKKFRETYCYPKTQTQNKILELISEITDKRVENGNRYIISPYELDIYIPAKKFAIEYNGNLWHSEYWLCEKKRKDKEKPDISIAKYKHHNKTNLCRENGIRLFQIFEHQWESRQKQILGFIRTILGENKISIAGRKCLITNTNTKQFIEDNHIQGKPHTALKYFNLEYNGEIVASMTAGRHHRQNSDSKDVVLSRLCFAENTNVQGGSSKLFKYFKEWAREQGFSRIISWSDNCWTEGNVYKVLGFELDKEYAPDYFYWDVNKHKYHSKQSQKKSAVSCPEGMTEREFCIERGLFRIWDCGKKLWRFELEGK